MNIGELMLGDLVRYKYNNTEVVFLGESEITRKVKSLHKIIEVAAIGNGGICYITKTVEGLDYYVNVDIKAIEPIALTTSILEKNGWVKNTSCSDVSYDLDCEVELWIGRDGHRWWWHVGEELVVPINYVHELQHVLKLCGIKLKIKI